MSLSEHLEKLRHFHRVAKFKSIREGSQSMGISQAGLSKSISALENVLETQLFIRSVDGLLLTKEGEQVLLSSERILNEAANIELKLRALKASSSPKTLRIGMYDSIAVYFFSELNSYIEALYPKVTIQLIVGSSASLATEIQCGNLDLAIGVSFEKRQLGQAEFFKLFEDHYSFYVSPKTQRDLNEMPLLIYPSAVDENGVSIEDHLKAVIKQRGVHRVFNFETLKTLTAQGVGIGVLPTQVARPLLKKNHLLSVRVPKKKNNFGRHSIGFFATESLLKSHRNFVGDIYRLGERWSKS